MGRLSYSVEFLLGFDGSLKSMLSTCSSDRSVIPCIIVHRKYINQMYSHRYIDGAGDE